MTKKFHHLGELLQYYDPVFAEYLRETHADDLLFCYRWLLLELKREFAFDVSLHMLEVMWASLPPNPSEGDLKLFDIDIRKDGNPLIARKLHQLFTPYAKLQALGWKNLVQETQANPEISKRRLADASFDCYPESDRTLTDGESSEDETTPRMRKPIRHESLSSISSCPISFSRTRSHSMLLEQGEYFSSYPPKFHHRSRVTSEPVANQSKAAPPRNSVTPPAIRCPDILESTTTRQLKPSEECAVSDQSTSTEKGTCSPVPVASEASMQIVSPPELSLSDIHELVIDRCYSVSEPARSRELSGVTNEAATGNDCKLTVARSNVNNPDKSRHNSSANDCGCRSYGIDSGVQMSGGATCERCSDLGSITTPYTHSVELASKGSSADRKLQDVIEFVNVEKDPCVLLPPPSELGDGNPFMMFICLTLLLEHRDQIIRKEMDYSEIATYFDRLVRKHDVRKVLNRARILYADYLKTGWRFCADG